jgi:hypothetical protein
MLRLGTYLGTLAWEVGSPELVVVASGLLDLQQRKTK